MRKRNKINLVLGFLTSSYPRSSDSRKKGSFDDGDFPKVTLKITSLSFDFYSTIMPLRFPVQFRSF